VVVAWFHHLAVYDVETRQQVIEFAPIAPDSVESLSVASQGRYVLIGPGQELQVRDTQTGQIVSERFPSPPDVEFSVHKLMFPLLERSLCPVFSPDGRYFATGNHLEIIPRHGTPQRRNDVVLWDASNWNEVRRFEGHERRITTVAFTADGRHIVSGSEDGSVRVWDRDSGAALRVCWGHDWSEGHTVTALAIHPNQRQVLSASRDKLVRLWELP
jgi:WD40 repeat protein